MSNAWMDGGGDSSSEGDAFEKEKKNANWSLDKIQRQVKARVRVEAKRKQLRWSKVSGRGNTAKAMLPFGFFNEKKKYLG